MSASVCMQSLYQAETPRGHTIVTPPRLLEIPPSPLRMWASRLKDQYVTAGAFAQHEHAVSSHGGRAEVVYLSSACRHFVASWRCAHLFSFAASGSLKRPRSICSSLCCVRGNQPSTAVLDCSRLSIFETRYHLDRRQARPRCRWKPCVVMYKVALYLAFCQVLLVAQRARRSYSTNIWSEGSSRDHARNVPRWPSCCLMPHSDELGAWCWCWCFRGSSAR